MSAPYGGKALLAIRRLHLKGESEHYEVTAFIQSCDGGENARDCAHEDFGLLEYDVLPLPGAAYKLKEPGDAVRVYVVYEFRYSQDYWGEWDVTLQYHKERVRRKQPWRPRNKNDRRLSA